MIEKDRIRNIGNKIEQTIILEKLNKKPIEDVEIKNKKRKTLPKGIDGVYVKLNRIKRDLINLEKIIKRTNQNKRWWSERDKKWTTKMMKYSPTIEIINFENKEELTKIGIEAKKISKEIGKRAEKRRKKYQKKDYEKTLENLEIAGWKGTKRFFQQILKKRKIKKSIRKIPEKYMKEGLKETEPEDIKKMIREFWQELYKKDEKIEDNQYTEIDKPWFKNTEW